MWQVGWQEVDEGMQKTAEEERSGVTERTASCFDPGGRRWA